MHIRVLAVGDRQPAWVDDAAENYGARLPREWKFRIECLPTARRAKGSSAQIAVESEGEQLLARIKSNEQVVLLDETGSQYSSQILATRLSEWQQDGRDLCFIIGGPDGVSDGCRQRADAVWSLSSLTLPHGLARVLLLEQLYRAWSLQHGHPYHRE